MSCRSAERPAGPPRQRGVALITVLLVFALATMMAAQMLRTSYLALRRTGNLIESTQARYYALGAEELGKQLLQQDQASARGGQATDHLRETWASDKLSFEYEDGRIELAITDLAGRFNLNSLADPAGKALPVEIARFARLLRAIDLDPSLAETVADWIDADGSTLRGGSEGAGLGVRSLPNQPMVEPSELRALPGLDAEGWKRLEPLVAALPPGTKLNINTAPPEVLAVFAEGARPADMERFVHLRDQQPIRDAADPRLAQLFGNALGALDVKSDFFSVRVHATYRERHARFETRMQRDPRKGTITVLGRSDAARM